VLKDPYNFDFLTLGQSAHERDVGRGLARHIQEFLVELGKEFAFVGSQYHLEVGGQDFYLDLLFYHLHLRCYVVIDLKISEFQPEYAGKMNFYLAAVDELLRHPDDQPSIGIVLRKSKNKLIVEYALHDVAKPIGVSDYLYTLVASLPDQLKGSLPTVEELEAELERMETSDRKAIHLSLATGLAPRYPHLSPPSEYPCPEKISPRRYAVEEWHCVSGENVRKVCL
jgi:hypothetical protein